jgi:hypothetical protein
VRGLHPCGHRLLECQCWWQTTEPQFRLSYTAYQSLIIIPYVNGISEELGHISNRFSFRTIFRTEHILFGTLTKTRPITDAQRRKQRVCSIPCDCGRCYIAETSRWLEARSHNLTLGLPEKSKLAQNAYDQGHKLCWNEAKVLQIQQNSTGRKCSGGLPEQWTQFAHVSHRDRYYRSRSQESYISVQRTLGAKIMFLCWDHTGNL